MDITLHAGAGCSRQTRYNDDKRRGAAMRGRTMTKRQRGSTPVPPDEVGVEPGGESRAVGAGHRAGRQQGTGVPGPVQATGDRGARVCAAD